MSICRCGWTGEPDPAASRVAARGKTRSTLSILNDLSPGTEGLRRRTRCDWLGLGVFCAAAVCTLVWLMILGRGLTFFFDEWDFINAAATTGYWHNVLQPHNGHPSMVPFSVYEVLLRTAGLGHYWPYQLVLALLDVGCGWLIFALLRRKIHPLAAAAAAAVLMLLGPAWQDLLWPFQIGFLGSVAGGLGALTLLDRNTRRSDVGACTCLVLAAASSGVALPFLAGVVVELAWHRRSWSRLWVPTVPIGLFLVWYETLGKSSSSSVSPSALVHSVASDTATTLGALVGRGGTAGDVLSEVFAALIVVAVVRSPGQAARLAMGASGLLTFWLLTLLTRGVSQDGASRYLYPAAALVLITAGELPKLITRNQRGRHAVGTRAWVTVAGTAAALGVVAYAAVAIWWNAGTLTSGSQGLAGVSSQVRSELGAVELAGSALPGTFQPDHALMPQVTVGPYLRAVREFGSSAASAQFILRPGDPLGPTLDAMLLRGRPMDVSSGSNPPGILTTGDLCTDGVFGPGHPTLVVPLPPLGAFVTAPKGGDLVVRVRSLSSSFPERPLSNISAGATDLVRWSARRTAIRWKMELTPVSAPAGSVATVCPAAAPSSKPKLPESARRS